MSRLLTLVLFAVSLALALYSKINRLAKQMQKLLPALSNARKYAQWIIGPFVPPGTLVFVA